MNTRVTVTFQMDVDHADEKSLEEFIWRMKQLSMDRQYADGNIGYNAETLEGTVSVEPL